MVERYVMAEYPHETCMDQDDAGPYVLHDDYAALQAENEWLKADLVDLERFLPVVTFAREHGCVRLFWLASDLLALIDAHKGE